MILRSMNVFIEFSGQLKKIAFPRIALPVIVWGTAMLNHLILLGATLIILLGMGYKPQLSWLALLPAIALMSTLAIALGILLGVFNVFARDISQVMGVVMQIWFWLTPIVYPANVLPEKFAWVVYANPLIPSSKSIRTHCSTNRCRATWKSCPSS
ncbi:MAG: ABC transporter permease [Hyphomicrobiaceae bacterium]